MDIGAKIFSAALATVVLTLSFIASRAACAATITATAGSLTGDVWSSFTPTGNLSNTNGTQIATGQFDYTTNSTTLAVPVGPTFTVTKVSGPTLSANLISTPGEAGFAPGQAPVAGTGFPATAPEQHDFGGNANATSTMSYVFSSALPTGSKVWVLDIDLTETNTYMFFDCSGNAINPSGFDFLIYSTTGLPNTRTFSATNVILQNTDGDGYTNPTDAIIIRSSSVCRVDITITSASTGSNDTFFSVPEPQVTLLKAIAGTGRLANTDQFTTQIKNSGGTLLNATTNSTTTGNGTTVTAGTGTTAATSVSANGTYTLTEAAAGTTVLSNYTGSVSCANSLVGSTTVLPSGAGQGFSLTPLNPLDNITCTLTNQPAPNVSITKTDNSTTYSPGGTSTYTINVKNIGGAVSGATVSDILPKGLTLTAPISVNPAANCTSGCSAGNVITPTTGFAANGTDILSTLLLNLPAGTNASPATTTITIQVSYSNNVSTY